MNCRDRIDTSAPIEVPGYADGHQASLAHVKDWLGHGSEVAARRLGSPATGFGAVAAIMADEQARWRDSLAGAGIATLPQEVLRWEASSAATPPPGDGDLQAAPAAAAVSLGCAWLWSALGASVQWFDVAMLARLNDGVVPLPVQVLAADPEQPDRCEFLLAVDAAADLRALDISTADLARALGDARASLWLAHRVGMGAFVSIGVHLTALRS